MTDITATLAPNLRTQFTNLINVLQNFKTNANENSMNYGGAPSVAEQAQAVVDLKAQIDTVISSINQIISTTAPVGQLQLLSNSAGTIGTSIDDALAAATALKTMVTSVEGYYTSSVNSLSTFSTAAQANVTAAVPVAKSQISTAVQTQQDALFSSFECRTVAADFSSARQGLCGNIVASLDAFWSSLAIMALWSLLSLPVTVYVANKLFLDLLKFQSAAADPEFKDSGDGDAGVYSKPMVAESVLQPVFYINKRIIGTKPVSPQQVSPPQLAGDSQDNLDEDPPIAEVDEDDENDENAVSSEDSESEYDDDDESSIVPATPSTALKQERKETIIKTASTAFDVDKEFGELAGLMMGGQSVVEAPPAPVSVTSQSQVRGSAPAQSTMAAKSVPIKQEEPSDESESESEEEESEEEESEEEEDSEEEQDTPEPTKATPFKATQPIAAPTPAPVSKVNISDERSPIDIAIEEKERAKERKRLEEEEMKKKFNWLETKGLVNKAKTLFDDEEED